VRPEQVDPDNWLMYQVANRAPEYHVTDTDWGTMYCAYRPAENNGTYWRFAHFAFPFWTFIPQGDFVDRVIARAWVPMDDTHVMFVGFSWKHASRTAVLSGGKPIPGATMAPEMLPNTTDWFGRFRPVQNATNDYLIDRDAQRNDEIYTGITHIAMQDQAITESMGAIVDHSFEHLAPSDQMITRTRRRLLMAARALSEKCTAPPCVDQPELFQQVRSGEAVLAANDWQSAYRERLQHAIRPVLAHRQAAE
jgi:phthalate 4,5-dioxygenase